MKNAGIDIGNHSIKLVELDNKKGKLELTRCGINLIGKGGLKAALQDLLSISRLSLKRVNVSLSGPAVIVRYIEMPAMKDEELRSAIKFEAEKYLPFKIKDSIIDCAIINKADSGNMRVLLVAAKRAEVDNLLSLFKEINLEINAIDADSFAFLNSFQRSRKDAKEEGSHALINMGAKFSNMNIVTKGDLYFTRGILWGGMDITERIKDAMGIGFDEAEALKMKPSDKRKEEVVSVVMSVLERLSSQIRISLDYFESQFGRSVEKIYVSGGTSYLFNIIDFLKDNLGVDVVMWNPFDGIAIAESTEEIERTPALFSVAVGLALRS